MSMECRPILLHNEFLPSISGPRQWDYQVLGRDFAFRDKKG